MRRENDERRKKEAAEQADFASKLRNFEENIRIIMQNREKQLPAQQMAELAELREQLNTFQQENAEAMQRNGYLRDEASRVQAEIINALNRLER